MNKYKVGDKVKILTHSSSNCGRGCASFADDMRQYIGTIQVIDRYIDINYQLVSICNWNFSDCMLQLATPTVATIKVKPTIPDLTICYNCSKKQLKNDIFKECKSELYCDNCFDDLITTCYSCEDNIPFEDSFADPNDNTICQFCYDDNSTYYCQDCFNDIAFSCYNCSEYYHQDNSNYCEPCENDYCEDCYSNHGCDSQEGFQTQELEFITGKKSKTITVNRFVGVEIEAENGTGTELNLPITFGIVSDDSLNNSGVEVVTPPSSQSALVSNIKLACKELKNANFEATTSTGLHVHIDLRDIKDNYIKLSRILRTFYAIEDVMFAMLPASRLTSIYCIPLRNNYKFYDFYGRQITKEFDNKIYQEIDKKRVSDRKTNRYDSKRYASCNFHSTFYRGTLEVRSHSGTHNPTKILKWCELLLKIADWSINHYNHSTIEQLLALDASNTSLKKKTHKMQQVFGFSKTIEKYINARVAEFKNESLTIPYTKGELPTRKRGKK